MTETSTKVPADAVALRLYRIVRGDLIACEAVQFRDGAPAIDTALRRARISGRVEIEGDADGHFADLLNVDGSMLATVALDAGSYRALKTKGNYIFDSPRYPG